MEKRWFTLHADTFIWLKSNIGIAYNSINNKKFIFQLSETIEKICHRLLKTESLYSTELNDDEVNNETVNQWIQSMINIQSGFLSHDITYEERPVSLKPILKVQDKKEYYEKKHISGERGLILQNLHELTFYINYSQFGNMAYYKQYVMPLKKCEVLDMRKILSFIQNSRNPFLANINFVGNLFAYPAFEKFISKISDFDMPCTIHIFLHDFLENLPKIKAISWQESIQFNILTDAVFDVSLIKDITLPFSITAFVFSENEFTDFSSIYEQISETHEMRIVPLYNGKNLSFFESNVFLDNEDLDNIDLSKNDIFMRQAFNIGDFGKLTVMPDGSVYANVNEPPLGTINDSPYSLVYKEFTEGKSWFKIRDEAPCNDCVYQWLCPSPSNYERAINRPNLCKKIIMSYD